MAKIGVLDDKFNEKWCSTVPLSIYKIQIVELIKNNEAIDIVLLLQTRSHVKSFLCGGGGLPV